MNLERTKPETLAAGVMDYMPQSLAAHEYAERLNAALARLGLTERLTLPSAPNTAIDELPAVVDVPLRKTLSVLMGKAQQGDASALATLEWTAQVAESIFAGLHARDFAGDRPLALPSHESLATLSQGVDALLPRKISTGWSVASLLADPTCDGIDDGVSLVRLLCSANGVTKLVDDNSGWVCDKAIPANAFPNLVDATLRMKSITAANALSNLGASGKVTMPELTTIISGASQYNDPMPLNATEIIADEVTASDAIFSQNFYPNLQKVSMKKVRSFNGRSFYDLQAEGPLKEVYLPELRIYDTWSFLLDYGGTRDKYLSLILLEIGSDVSCNISNWNPTNALSSSASDLVADPTAHPTWKNLDQFLSNFKTYIAERLKGGYAVGTGPTLTLSKDVRNAIEGDPTIAQIITSKGWSISPAPTA